MDVSYLAFGERLVRVHRFRYTRPLGCAFTINDILVEEALGHVSDESQRCMARPDHPELVIRPEFVAYGESVEAAVKACIERIRPRRVHELFLPKG
jgi:hypothetical protein